MAVMVLPANTPEAFTVTGTGEFVVVLFPNCPLRLKPQVMARPGDGWAAAPGAINTPTATATPTTTATGVFENMAANLSAGTVGPPLTLACTTP